MKNLCGMVMLLILTLATAANGQNFLRQIAGNWEGTLEYLDYSEKDKRVKLKTYLTIIPNADGNSAEFQTVYDDFGKIITDRETIKIDGKKYFVGATEYQIESAGNGKIVLRGAGLDGEKVEPIRETISFSIDSLEFLKETRTPWQFRNQMIFKRTAENALTAKMLTTQQLKEDFDVFKKGLTALHPGIYRYQTPSSLAKLFDELENKLKTPLAERDFYKLLAQFTTQIYCGHTYLNPYNQKGLLRERAFGGKKYLPFYFQIVDHKIIVTENAAAQKLAKGSEITKINDIPVKQIIEKLLTVTTSDGRNTLAHRVATIELIRFEAERFAFFDWYFSLFFPFDETFKIEAVDAATRKIVKFEIPAMTKTERTAEMAKRYGASPAYDDGWKFALNNNSTATLTIANSITWKLKKIKFNEFLATVFAELRTKKIENLIIDVRGNDGGDSDIGFELSKYLATKDLPVYSESKRLVRNVSPQLDLAKYLQMYDKDLKSTIQNGVPASNYRAAENGYFEILPNEKMTNYARVTPSENNFRGQTFVIADSIAASATFQFLDYVKTNKLAMIVGQESGGNRQGINGGNYYFLYLPNSTIEIDIPVYFFAPVAPQKDAGVIPDFIVKSKAKNIANGIDAEILAIERIIEKEKK